VQMGSVAPDAPGYDLRGVMIGSEGTLGIVTKITVRLIPRPTEARTLLVIFDVLEDAGRAVSMIIARGIIPAAMEIMDKLTMQAVEEAVHAGYPPDAEAALLIEVDGYADGLDDLSTEIQAICREFEVREIRTARSNEERAGLWKGRKTALGAMGRIAPSYSVQDGVVPRSRLPEVLHYAVEVSARYGIKIANVLHAGDGNLHPLVTFDPRQAGALDLVRQASGDLLKRCVDLGGTITGEHGVGLEKQDFMLWMYNECDLKQMRRLKSVFDPADHLNPGKMFPGARLAKKVVAGVSGA
jgi:glycolate oxidase